MTKIIKVFALLLFIAIGVLAGIGLTAPPESIITETLVVESPPAVVWRELTDIESYNQWRLDILRARLKTPGFFDKGAVLQIVSLSDTSGVYEEIITRFDEDKSLTFLRSGLGENVVLQDYTTGYTLRSLKNSSTEVTVNLSYRPLGLIMNTYDRLFLRSKLNRQMEANLTRLKNRLENI